MLVFRTADWNPLSHTTPSFYGRLIDALVMCPVGLKCQLWVLVLVLVVAVMLVLVVDVVRWLLAKHA